MAFCKLNNLLTAFGKRLVWGGQGMGVDLVPGISEAGGGRSGPPGARAEQRGAGPRGGLAEELREGEDAPRSSTWLQG